MLDPFLTYFNSYTLDALVTLALTLLGPCIASLSSSWSSSLFTVVFPCSSSTSNVVKIGSNFTLLATISMAWLLTFCSEGVLPFFFLGLFLSLVLLVPNSSTIVLGILLLLGLVSFSSSCSLHSYPACGISVPFLFGFGASPSTIMLGGRLHPHSPLWLRISSPLKSSTSLPSYLCLSKGYL